MAGTGRSAASSGSQIRAARRAPSAMNSHSVSIVRTRRGNSVTTRIRAFNPTRAGGSPVGGKTPPADPPSQGLPKGRRRVRVEYILTRAAMGVPP